MNTHIFQVFFLVYSSLSSAEIYGMFKPLNPISQLNADQPNITFDSRCIADDFYGEVMLIPQFSDSNATL